MRNAIANDEPEEWRPIPEVPRYQASSFGRIRNEDGVILRPRLRKDGYLQVGLSKPISIYGHGASARLVRAVHSLVLSAFAGPRPRGMEGRHFPDPDKTNNRVDNLQWGTPQQNSDDHRFHEKLLQIARYGMTDAELSAAINTTTAVQFAAFKNSWPRLHQRWVWARGRSARDELFKQWRRDMEQTKAELLAEKQRIEEALREVRERELAGIIVRMEELAADLGVTVRTFMDQYIMPSLDKKPSQGKKQPASSGPKYASPHDSRVTWSGKGPAPSWFNSAIKEGFSAKDMEIATQEIPRLATNGAAH